MLSFSVAEDVSRVNTQFYDEWRVSAALSWMCEHGDVEQRLVGAGHAVSRSHESRHRVFPPCHNSLATRRQGKVPIFTHFSGSLIQEFSYSLEFSYSRTLLMNLEWDTFTWPARARHRGQRCFTCTITHAHAIKSIQAEAKSKSKATDCCSDTRYLRN